MKIDVPERKCPHAQHFMLNYYFVVFKFYRCFLHVPYCYFCHLFVVMNVPITRKIVINNIAVTEC